MNRFRTLPLLALLALGAAPLAAQQAPAPPSARGAGAHASDGQQRGPIQRLLQERTELGLSETQVTRLAQIDAAVRERNRPLVEELVRMRRALRGDTPPGEMTPEQRAEYRRRLEAARPLMERIRHHNHEAMREVREVLTPAQRDRLRAMLREEAERRPRPRDGRTRTRPDGDRRAPEYR